MLLVNKATSLETLDDKSIHGTHIKIDIGFKALKVIIMGPLKLHRLFLRLIQRRQSSLLTKLWFLTQLLKRIFLSYNLKMFKTNMLTK